MPIMIDDDLAMLTDVCTVEEAEPLLEWLRHAALPRVNLAACSHLHAAVLQVLLAARPRVAAPPANAFVARVCAGLEPAEAIPATPGRDGETL